MRGFFPHYISNVINFGRKHCYLWERTCLSFQQKGNRLTLQEMKVFLAGFCNKYSVCQKKVWVNSQRVRFDRIVSFNYASENHVRQTIQLLCELYILIHTLVFPSGTRSFVLPLFLRCDIGHKCSVVRVRSLKQYIKLVQQRCPEFEVGYRVKFLVKIISRNLRMLDVMQMLNIHGRRASKFSLHRNNFFGNIQLSFSQCGLAHESLFIRRMFVHLNDTSTLVMRYFRFNVSFNYTSKIIQGWSHCSGHVHVHCHIECCLLVKD